MSITDAAKLSPTPPVPTVLMEKRLQDQRELNLASIEAWELYNQENEALQSSESRGWLASAFGTVQDIVDRTAKWRLENELVASVKGMIQNREAATIRAALELIQKNGLGDIQQRASFYLKSECRITKGNPLGALIDYGSVALDGETVRLLLQRAFEGEYEDHANASALAIFRLVKRFSADAGIQALAQEHIDAHEGKSSFGRALQKTVFAASGEELALDVLTFKGAARAGQHASGAVGKLAEKAALSKGSAWLASKASYFLAEGHVMFVGNTLKAAALQNPEQVLEKEHLAKSYKSNFIMLGITKVFGKFGKQVGWNMVNRFRLIEGESLTLGGRALMQGAGHGSGLIGMIASTQVNEAWGYKEKPKGGINEALAQDSIGYLAYGIANPLLKGRLAREGSEFSFDIRELGKRAKSLSLQPAYAFVSTTGIGGGGIRGKSRPKSVEKGIEEQLIARIKEPNDDPDVWQVLGDLLLDRGDVRGEAIQIDERLSDQTLEPSQREGLTKRKGEVEARLAEELFQNLGMRPELVELTWHRGFLDTAQFRYYPGIEKVTQLFQAKEAICLRGLDLSSLNLRSRDIRALVELPQLQTLASLSLWENKIDAEGAVALATAPYLHSLKRLHGGFNRIGAEGAAALANSPTLNSVTSLDLAGNNIGPEGARAIAGSRYLRSLKSLCLFGNNIGPAGTRALAESPILEPLTNLDLASNSIGAEGARFIADSHYLKSLTSLCLFGNNIGAEGARALAQSPILRSVTTLHLQSNNILDAGAQFIADSPHLRSLTILDMIYNDIGEVGARALRESPNFPMMKELRCIER